MKRLVLLFLPCLLLWASASFASTPANPADYTIAIHVSSSRTISQCVEFVSNSYCYPLLVLNVTIDNTKLELKGTIENASKQTKFYGGDGYLALGDYKAKLTPNKTKSPDVAYFVMKSYEMILPDGRLAQFQVTGQSD